MAFATVAAEAQQTTPYGETLQRRRTLLKALEVGSGDIVFLGNSITQGGEWSELFGRLDVKNRGISGDRVEWLFDRVDYLIEGRPRKLFLMIGINDISAGRTAEQVVADITRLIDMWHKGSPETIIYIQSILPFNYDQRPKSAGKNEEVVKANESLRRLSAERGITYIDLYSVLADGNGMLNADYSLDGLHLTGEGYLLWADAIREYVK